MRVVPRLESLGRARRTRGGTPQRQQRPHERDTVEVGHRRHALQARRTGSASEAEEDRLGLVVERVPHEHGRRAGLARDGAQRPVARVAGRRFESAAAVHIHLDHAGGQSQR